MRGEDQKTMGGQSKVIDFNSRKPKAFISQLDLAEERLLTDQVLEALAKLREKRSEIRRLLEAGATVEPGLRRAKILTRRPLVIR